jgi:hypothetical protein
MTATAKTQEANDLELVLAAWIGLTFLVEAWTLWRQGGPK